MHPSALSTRAVSLEKILGQINADVYVGYNIDTLMPIHRVASKKGALTVFDCQEFYSDMGDWQTAADRKIIAAVEKRYLSKCDLLFAASDQMAIEIASVYKLRRPLALYNTPPRETELEPIKEERFTLYWRNSTIDLGSRGLGDVIAALEFLPAEIVLHLQGHLPPDGGMRLRRIIEAKGLSSRVVLHAPYLPQEAVKAASRYTIGLCLEQASNRNQLLTVSNKMFDYFMAGLAVVASDLPGLRDVVQRSQGGILYEAGNSQDLAEKITRLYEDRVLTRRLASNARTFALAEGNLEHELNKLRTAFLDLVKPSLVQVA
jgi:glycosyltransferase involved in cell wall biosynthesis